MKKDIEGLCFFRCKIINWYSEYGRHFPWRNKSATKYQIIVSEVLLQRTRAESVAKIYHSFFMQYPSWNKLAIADEEELAALIKPLGLWKRRTKNLLSLANEMTTKRGRFPKDREKIERLPNVGQYIANAIMLFCHEKPQPLLDTNMARVLERFFGPRLLSDIRHDPYLQSLANEVVNCDRSKELNWAILDFASTVCSTKKPSSGLCPLKSNCRYFQSLQL